jgi:lipopolysaccharide export system protein LptC
MSHTTTSMLDNVGGRGFTITGRSDNEDIFRRARRHSRLVRLLRIAAPVTLLALIGGLAFATWLEPLRALARLPVSGDHLVVSGTKITMAAPKLSGFTNDGRKYDLSARAATQDVTNPDVIEFHDITAKFEAPDKTKLDLTALDGVFNRKTGLLTLRRDVLLVSSNGYRVRLNEVRVDTKTSNVVSEQPVEVTMLQGTLNAKRLEVLKSGEVLNFDGGVKMKLILNEQHTAPETPAKP